MSPAARCYKARAKHTSSRELVQTSTRASNGNDVQVLGTRVIGAVDHSTHRETERHSELVSSSTSASYTLTHRRGPPTTLSSSSHSCVIILDTDDRKEEGYLDPTLQIGSYPSLLVYAMDYGEENLLYW